MKLTEDRFLIFIFLLNGFMFYMQSLTAFGLMSLISPVTFRYGFINYFPPVIINSLQIKFVIIMTVFPTVTRKWLYYTGCHCNDNTTMVEIMQGGHGY